MKIAFVGILVAGSASLLACAGLEEVEPTPSPSAAVPAVAFAAAATHENHTHYATFGLTGAQAVSPGHRQDCASVADRVSGLVLEGVSTPPGFPKVATVRVALPELGLETTTDSEGGFQLCHLGLTQERLVTVAAEKDNYSRYILKNFVVGPARAFVPTITLYRDGPPITEDFCALEDGPSLSAALHAERDLPCSQFAVGPQWLLRDCPHHAFRQEFVPGGGRLVGITGIVIDENGGPVAAAAIALGRYGLTTRSDDNGCFGFDRLELTMDSGGQLITLQVMALGYRPLTLSDWPMSGNVGIDVVLEAGDAPQTIDRCVFESPPASGRDRGLAELCAKQGALRLPGTGGPPPGESATPNWALVILGVGGLAAAVGAGLLTFRLRPPR